MRPVQLDKWHQRDLWTSHRSNKHGGRLNGMGQPAVRAMRGIIRHPVSGISDVDLHGTIGGHQACIATTGAPRDEEQEEQCFDFSGEERQPGNSVEEGAERLRPSTDRDPEVRQRPNVPRTMRDVWESVAAHSPGTGSRDDAEQSHSACVHRESTERPFCPHGHGSMMMQATPQ